MAVGEDWGRACWAGARVLPLLCLGHSSPVELAAGWETGQGQLWASGRRLPPSWRIPESCPHLAGFPETSPHPLRGLDRGQGSVDAAWRPFVFRCVGAGWRCPV